MRRVGVRECGCLIFFALLLVQSADGISQEILPVQSKSADFAADDPRVKFFEDKVRPILVDQCQKCHGAAKQQSSLRLDSRSSAIQGGDNGPAIVPGDPDQSLLMTAVRRQGDFEMPPDRSLSEGQIKLLEQWIRDGAAWTPGVTTVVAAASPAGFAKARSEHWAFQPVRRVAAPAVRNTDWPFNLVDQFVLAKLEEQGLLPSPMADRPTLLRRLTFDLTGLPPTMAEIRDFVSDNSPDAYSRAVDRLLASPHYGERWARFWLDIARYSDTKGYVFFEDGGFPWAWTYRDYVIESLNSDLPFNQFVMEQLAADKLSLGDQRRSLRALGYLTLGGRFMNNPHDIIDDRIDVVSRGLMGLTISCARCHDHKFDPIPATDYYGLYGVFASSAEPIVPPLYQSPPDSDEYRKFAAELSAREGKLREFVVAKQGEVVNGSRTRVAEYMMAAYATRGQPRTDDFMLLADGGDVNPKMARRWQIYLEQAEQKHHPVLAVWLAAIQLKEEGFAAALAEKIAMLDNETNPALRINPLVLQRFKEQPAKKISEVADRYGIILNEVEKEWQEILQQSATRGELPPSQMPDPAKEELRLIFHGANSPTKVAVTAIGDLDLLPDRGSQGKLRELRTAIESFRAAGPVAPPRAMTLEDMPEPVEPRVFRRGNPNQLGEATTRHFPRIIAGDDAPAFRNGSGRLELAQNIVDRKNPLTARVFVNRIWLQHFGAGLVRTPSDFGMRSDSPSHPELLDYLATEFMDHGWSIKHLHRQILLSATYQQSSRDRSEALAVDPENRTLWRMNRRRLELESLRDAMLIASGRLDRTLGGASFNLLASPTVPRRTVYASIDRLALPSLFRTFDFPSPDTTSPQRDSTTVAPQALFMMNHPFTIETAQLVGQRRELLSADSFDLRVEQAFQSILGRSPTMDDKMRAITFFRGSSDQIVESPEVWTMFTHALLMTNEFVFID